MTVPWPRVFLGGPRYRHHSIAISTGVLPGQSAFAASRYVFSADSYLRVRAADGVPDAPAAPIQPAWGLPASWITVDAVFGGGGAKSGFAYFFRGPDYVRYDWSTDTASPGHPKKFGPNWHTTPDFAAGIDGSLTGQGSFATKAYLFRTDGVTVDSRGALAPTGTAVRTTRYARYARYDYTTETFEFTVTDPADIVASWPGLLPLLDAAPAVDRAVGWIDRTLATLGGGAPTAAALTNPSSYAAFAQEIALGTDARFGIGRPHE